MEKQNQSIEKNPDPRENGTHSHEVINEGDNEKHSIVATGKNKPADKLDFLLDIPLEITVEIGRTKMLISELLKLGHGSIIELEKLSGESMEVLANQKLIAKGEVVSIEKKYGIRLTEIISPKERVESLK